MAIKLASTKGLTREEWLKMRLNGIGGSDISAVLGFNKYRNAVSVWLEKTGQIEQQEIENRFTKMGNLLEPIVAGLFAEEHPELKVVRNNFILQCDDVPYALANLDRELICKERGRGVLEIKTTSQWNADEWNGENVPDAYMFQLQWYMMITGYQYGYLAVLIGGNDYRSFYVDRDETIIDYMKEKAAIFWGQVKNLEMPMLDGSDASKEAINFLFPPDFSNDTDSIELGYDLLPMLDELQAIKAQVDELDERKEFLKAQIMLNMHNHQKAHLMNYRISWKPQTRNSVDSKKLKKDFPDIYAACTKQSESRPFTLTYKEN